MKNGKTRRKVKKEEIIGYCPDCNLPITNAENYDKFHGYGATCWRKHRAKEKEKTAELLENLSKIQVTTSEKTLKEIEELMDFGKNFKQISDEFEKLGSAFENLDEAFEKAKTDGKAAAKLKLHLERKKKFIFNSLLANSEVEGMTSGSSCLSEGYEIKSIRDIPDSLNKTLNNSVMDDGFKGFGLEELKNELDNLEKYDFKSISDIPSSLENILNNSEMDDGFKGCGLENYKKELNKKEKKKK